MYTLLMKFIAVSFSTEYLSLIDNEHDERANPMATVVLLVSSLLPYSPGAVRVQTLTVTRPTCCVSVHKVYSAVIHC